MRPSVSSSLEVALVNARTEDAPLAPQVIAQADVDGGGTSDQGLASSPLPRTGDAPDTVVLEALRKRQAQLEAEQLRLLTIIRSPETVPAAQPTAHPWPDADARGNADDDQDSVILQAQIAALSDRINAYNQRPRTAFVAPSAVAGVHAAYVDAWRARVETIGTRHFPDEARGHTYGVLRMTVFIRADGSVADAVIDQPAESPILNRAARRIVQLAAPFPPFPPELSATTDLLAITRSWHFLNDSLDMRSP